MDAVSKYSDIYTDWHMDDDAGWRKEWVKDAFTELHQLWTTSLATSDTPSCRDVDLATIEILDKHRKGDAAAYQAIFVALLLRVMDAKAHDDFAQRPCWVLSHGWKSRYLSLFLAKLLREDTLPSLLALHRDVEAKHELLSFFHLK
jgi:hypothetical protein